MTDPLVPHLRLVHSYPHAFPTIGIDKGAIRFVLAGASLMVPGLTSEGGRLPDPAEGERTIEAGEVAVVMAQGKEEACLVGVLNMGTEACRRDKKGVAMEAGHYLGDGLWRLVVE